MEPRIEADACLAQRPKWGWASTLVALLDVVLLGMLGLFDLYSLTNTSGHTGMPVMWVAWFYLLVALVGLALVRASRRGVLSPAVAWVFLCVGVAGFLNVLLFERMNIIVQYDDWLKRPGNP